MEEMLKLTVLCIAFSLIVIIVGQGSRTMGSLVALTAGVVLFVFLAEKMAAILELLRSVLAAAGIEETLFLPVFKVLGIAMCGRMGGALCRDMGSQWAACSLEIFAVLSSLVCMLPLVESVLQMVHYL